MHIYNKIWYYIKKTICEEGLDDLTTIEICSKRG